MREGTIADFDAIVGWIARDSGLDASAAMGPFLYEPANVCLIEGDGGALFIWRGPSIYEVHVMFAQRGREVIELSHRMLNYMRDTYGARTFWASVPWDTSKQSRKVRLFTRLMGWESRGRVNFAHGLCEVFISE